MFLLSATPASFTVATAASEELFNETVQVGNLDYNTITRTVDITGKNNVRLMGQIDVLSGGDITVYVMDADAYHQFQTTGEARQYALYAVDNVASQTLEVPIGRSGSVYVVLDNTLSLLTSKSVKVRLSLSYETPFFTTEVIAGLVVAIVAVAGIGAFLLMRRRPKVKAGSGIQQVMTQGARKNCIHCGAMMHEMARTCPACGKEQTT